jgi:hypothetical protein
MDQTAAIESQRQRVVEQMMHLGAMRRGTLNEQYLRDARKGAGKSVLRGPYYVLSRKESGRTVSQRIRTRDVERVRREMDCYSRFMELCREFVDLSERLGQAERHGAEREETLKKTPNLPSRRTRR